MIECSSTVTRRGEPEASARISSAFNGLMVDTLATVASIPVSANASAARSDVYTMCPHARMVTSLPSRSASMRPKVKR